MMWLNRPDILCTLLCRAKTMHDMSTIATFIQSHIVDKTNVNTNTNLTGREFKARTYKFS